MSRTTIWRRLLPAWAGALACLAAPPARADASASIAVTRLQVAVRAIAPGGVPAVSFAGAGGSDSVSEAALGVPPPGDTVSFASAVAFGPAGTATPYSPLVDASARLAGDVFGPGATVQASAFASSAGPAATGQGTIGLVDGVSAAAFTLAPWTEMTITAQVLALASVTGGSPDEFADSGLMMTIGDSTGLGPQWDRINLDALALGLFGAASDGETWSVSLGYVNDTGAPITGLFSGYVAALAYSDDPVSPVPEPGPAWTAAAGLLLVAAATRRRGCSRA
jgi:hypothetical protein